MNPDRTETLLTEGLARIGEAAFPDAGPVAPAGGVGDGPGRSVADGPEVPTYGADPSGAARRHRGPVVLAAAACLVVLAAAAVALAGDGGSPDRDLAADRTGEAEVGVVPLTDGPFVSRQGHVAARVGDEVIIWGGQDNIQSSSTADTGPQRDDGAAYDLHTGTWRVIAASPLSAREGAHSTVFAGEMYVVGGIRRGSRGLKDAAAYDPSADRWRRLPDVPVECLVDLAPIASGVLALGQCAKNDPAEEDPPIEAVVYDPATDRWSTVTAPPVQWLGLMVANDGQVVVEDGASHHLFAYDAATGGWNDLGAPPIRDYMGQDAVAIADDGRVVVIVSVLKPDGNSDGRRLVVRDREGWGEPRAIDAPPPEMFPFPSSIVVDGDRLIWTGWGGVAWYDLGDGSTGYDDLRDEGIGLAGTPDIFAADPVGDVVLWGGADPRRDDHGEGAVITLP